MNKLSIIVPAYNEEPTLEKVLKQIDAVKISLKKEILVVDDGSSDNTLAVAKRISKRLKSQTKVLSHGKNKGKGAAVRTGISRATGDIVIIQDADLEYDPIYFAKLVKPILNGETKVVYGSRFINLPIILIGKDKTPHPHHYFGNKFLTFLTNTLYGSSITDMETCYKVFDAKVIKGLKLSANRFDIEPEITSKLLKKDIKIVEVSIKVKPRSYKEGKKISWVDGIGAFWMLLKNRI